MEYLVIDTESCTGKPNDGSLCSLGYAVCDDELNILSRGDILFNPLPKFFIVGDKKKFKKIGITFAYSTDEFRKSKRFSGEYERIKSLFDGRIVLGFSMSNDIKYINDACEKFSLPIIEYEFYDIQYLYTLLNPKENAIGLKTLCAKYGNEFLEHRSDEDAVASVKLLKAFLAENNLKFDEFIAKFGVHRGVNSNEGYYFNYSDAVIKGDFGLIISGRVKSALFNEYLSSLPHIKRRKRVAFSHKVEKLDINELRTLIDIIYEKGYVFVRDKEASTLYVHGNDEENCETLSLKTRQITIGEFKKEFGYEKNNSYDDEKFYEEYYTKKQR